jgi:hypothetical protein
MGVYPLIKPRDIIVEREGKKWRVNSVRQTERLRSPIHQEVSLTLIPPGDIEYKIPLKFPADTSTRRVYSYRDDIWKIMKSKDLGEEALKLKLSLLLAALQGPPLRTPP